ncbi:MAG: SIMPL domain-containing protein [Candidatus Pacebacteria bacterium]|nr:SIMPL domain-containing protein [Candidatus Paceibacterota bacterium]
MEKQAKNYLWPAIILVSLAIAFSSVFYVITYSKSIAPSSYRSFTVSGDGKITTVPDVAQFTFSVITEGGMDVGASQAKNTEKVNASIDFVKSNGIDPKDIKTEGYNLSPRYQYSNCGIIYSGSSSSTCPPPEIVGYTITQTVSVKIRDFSKIGKVLSGVVEKGANSVSQLSFTVDDPTVVRNDARDEAIKKAKEKAKSMAESAGFKVGKLISIYESDGYPYSVYEKGIGIGMGGDTVSSVSTIEPGSQEISVNVSLTYEIK